MKKMIGGFLDKVQRALSKSDLCVFVSRKVANQCNGVIRARMHDGTDMRFNGEQWLIDRLAPNSRYFIDVGANKGNWSLAFMGKMRSAGRGILFEPSPLANKIVSEVMSTKGHVGKIELLQAAVSDEIGSLSFFMEDDAGETSSLSAIHSNVGAKEILVEVTTIDAELGKRNITHVDVMKVDAEGYDLHVLKGSEISLRNNRIGVVQFEYNKPWLYAGSTLFGAINYLEKYGYKVFLLKKDGIYSFDYKKYGDYFGYSNFVAVTEKYLNLLSGNGIKEI